MYYSKTQFLYKMPTWSDVLAYNTFTQGNDSTLAFINDLLSLYFIYIDPLSILFESINMWFFYKTLRQC